MPKRRILAGPQFACLGRAIHERRGEHGFLLSAWVFLPDHEHAIVFPRHPFTISEVMESIKVSSTKRINRAGGERGLLWQARSFDRALRTAKEYQEKVEYIHLNPVQAGRVSRPEDWRWSSVHDYTGSVNAPTGSGSAIPADRVVLPADERRGI